MCYVKARSRISHCNRKVGESHLIARSYIDGVKKGESINPNDVKALVKLADDMRKCQNVLTELRFASDLDSTGTIESILDRLPESLQNQWIKKSSKILNMGREPTFQDLTTFVEERADDVNSKYGQYIAEKRSAVSTNPNPHDQFNKSQDTNKSKSHERQRSQPVTTLSTEVHSTAGPDVKQKCAHCVREGHVIWRCFKFKGLSVDGRKNVAKDLNLCYRCLREDHDSRSCQRKCATCDGEHSTLLHDQTDTKETSDNGDE